MEVDTNKVDVSFDESLSRYQQVATMVGFGLQIPTELKGYLKKNPHLSKIGQEKADKQYEILSKLEEDKKNAPQFTIKKFVFYTVDLEPISIEDAKGMIEAHVFNRISTNSIVVWKEVEEIPRFEEWHDMIKWNIPGTDIKEYDDLFKKHDSFKKQSELNPKHRFF